MKKITAFGFGIMIGAVGSKMVDTVMDKYVFTMENFARLVGLQARINSRFDDMEDVNAFKTEITKYLIYHPSCDGLTVKNVYDLIDRVTTRPARRSNVDYSMFRWNRDALLNLKIDTACFHNGPPFEFPGYTGAGPWQAPPLEMRRERGEFFPHHAGKGSLLSS